MSTGEGEIKNYNKPGSIHFYLLLFGAFFLEAAGYIAFPYIALQLRNQYAISASQIGLIMLMALWVRPIASLLGGYIAEFIPYLWIFAVACLAESICFFTLGLSHVAIIAVSGIIIGNIGFSIWTPNLFALIYEWYPINEQFSRVAKLSGTINAGAAVGCLVGALISSANMKLIFVFAGTAYIFVIPILGFILRGHRAKPKDKTTVAPTKSWDKIQTTLIAVATLTFWASYGQFNSFFSIFANDWLKSNSVTGIAFGAVALGVSLVSYVLGALKTPPTRFFQLSLFSLGIFILGWLFMSLHPNFPTTICYVIGITLGEAFMTIYLAERWGKTNPAHSHLIQGLNFTFRNLGMGIGGLLSGLSYSSPEVHTLATWGFVNTFLLVLTLLSVVLISRSEIIRGLK